MTANTEPPPAPSPTRSPGVMAEVAQCLRFFSRLPIPPMPGETDPHGAPDFSRMVRVLPLAGAVIGAIGGLALMLALALRLPPFAAALIGIAAIVLATGALHEDGLADTADGFGGGMTIARRLEIMADSRVGTYGAVAIALSLLLRGSLLATLAERTSGGGAALVLVAVAAASRTVALLPMWLLPPARPGGKSAAVGRPADRTMAIAAVLAAAIGLLLLTPGFGPGRALASMAAASLAAWPVIALSRRMIGGQTGDVAGATQQVAEIAMLLVLASRL